ncbi:hypothetical protein EG328_007815 [Venturia inaequalis]|uniref:Uncharacterized protein n=1 Tax=Venturia inaequalis TaxID=5025 RepID=A0A8H3UDB2_VENIN|nr:hypothetical protein EG328_007815 [Venturia inaequalis]
MRGSGLKGTMAPDTGMQLGGPSLAIFSSSTYSIANVELFATGYASTMAESDDYNKASTPPMSMLHLPWDPFGAIWSLS